MGVERLKERLADALRLVRAGGSATRLKRNAEMDFWRSVQAREGELGNSHYVFFYTTAFDLDPAFYAGKRVLDIGCGPRGSLEWADMAARRVGLDPLVSEYRQLGIDRHAMEYADAGSEAIPFPDASFDVVTTFNSLDHVDDLDKTVAEIIRVAAPGGTLLVITDVNHQPTPTEPIAFGWDVLDRFRADFDVVSERHLEKTEEAVYQSVKAGVPYNEAKLPTRYGILLARLDRR